MANAFHTHFNTGSSLGIFGDEGHPLILAPTCRSSSHLHLHFLLSTLPYFSKAIGPLRRNASSSPRGIHSFPGEQNLRALHHTRGALLRNNRFPQKGKATFWGGSFSLIDGINPREKCVRNLHTRGLLVSRGTRSFAPPQAASVLTAGDANPLSL